MQITRQTKTSTRRSGRSAVRSHFERLEPRALFSATFDTFQLPAGTSSSARLLAEDSGGNLYAAGSATDAQGTHTVVRRLTLGAPEWETIFDAATGTGASGLAVDSSGRLFVSRTSGSDTDVFICQTPAGSNPVFSLVNHAAGDFEAMAADGAGNVFQVGSLRIATAKGTSMYWVVRKLAANGNATLVDQWNGGFAEQRKTPDAAYNRTAKAISVLPDGSMYVVGNSDLPNTPSANIQWVARKSSDQGAHWSTVDSWNYDPAMPAGATAVAGDANGNVYVLGFAGSQKIIGYKGKTPIYGQAQRWVVRSSHGGAAGSWTTIDNQLLQQGTAGDGADTQPLSLAIDSTGAVYAGGYYKDSSSAPTIGVIRTLRGGTWTQTTTSDFASRNLLVNASDMLYVGGQQVAAHLWTVQTFSVSSAAVTQLSSSTLLATPHRLANAHITVSSTTHDDLLEFVGN